MNKAIEYGGGFLAILTGWLFGGMIAAPFFLMAAGLFAIAAALCGLPAIILYKFVMTMIGG